MTAAAVVDRIPLDRRVRRRWPCRCGHEYPAAVKPSRTLATILRKVQAQALPNDYIRPAASLLLLRRADLRVAGALGPALVRAIAENA